MSRHLSTRNISSNRQTDRQTKEHGQKHVPRPLSEVINDLWFSMRRWLVGEKGWQQMKSGYCEGLIKVVCTFTEVCRKADLQRKQHVTYLSAWCGQRGDSKKKEQTSLSYSLSTVLWRLSAAAARTTGTCYGWTVTEAIRPCKQWNTSSLAPQNGPSLPRLPWRRCTCSDASLRRRRKPADKQDYGEMAR